eukprot:TRINITY_DN452_c0_g1_i1.p1 TRINITY_DN452_c0_g1~~TRINITY_DN452_c0_g1_i1.p1  ORF type:complete len:691 (-),score=227.82 TRINITY_DN452_c0_g1_i1:114-2099(-)
METAAPVPQPPAEAEAAPTAMEVDGDDGLVQPSNNDIRTIIDNTAKWVVKNGESFENKIMKQQAENPQFAFLFPGNGYYAYYQQKVRELRKAEEKALSPEEMKAQIARKLKLKKALLGELPMEEIESTLRKKKAKDAVVLEPPPKEEWVIEKPAISAQQDDIVKLTAQFVARNGRAFQNGLLAREHTNPLFSFLQPNHPLHYYFKILVQQYTTILLPEKTLLDGLKGDGLQKSKIVERVMKKVRWERAQKKDLVKKREKEEAERIQNQQIDWHEFVIVQTIEMEDPVTEEEEEAGAAMEGVTPTPAPAAKTAGPIIPDNLPAAMEVDTQEAAPPPVVEPEPAMDIDLPETIPADVTNYNPRARAGTQVNKLQYITPSGQNVDLSDMEEHMKIELSNLRALEERKKQEAAEKPSNLAGGRDILSSLSGFKNRRADIFTGAQKVEEKKAVKKPVWDGHAGSVDLVTAEVSGGDVMTQIRQIHSQKGIATSTTTPVQPAAPAPVAPAPTPSVVDTPRLPPPVAVKRPNVISAPPVTAVAFQKREEPAYKKPKIGETVTPAGLVPEAQWISSHPSPVTVIVRAPVQKHDKWNLVGQVLNISINVKETVKSLKQKVMEATNMPLNKQKLTSSTQGPLKDSVTLGFYNVADGHLVVLSVKSRGGRKK